MNTSHLMFDLETEGLPDTATAPITILSIGACIFDPRSDEIGPTFYRNVDPESCRRRGFHSDPNTIEWWKTEDSSALAEDQRDIQEALNDFILFILNHPYQVSRYWANSPTFDKEIISRAMRACGYRFPLPFWKERCLRTVKDICLIDGKEGFANPAKHNALADAIHQARVVQLCYSRIDNVQFILP